MEQLVVFRLGNEEYAVSISAVKEIVGSYQATKLPNMPDYIEGVIHLRGKVIPVVDLAKRFGLTLTKLDGKQAVIVEASGREVGVVVDEVKEVLRIADNAIEPIQAVVNNADEFLRGIGKLEKRLLIILDLDKLFSEEETRVLKVDRPLTC